EDVAVVDEEGSIAAQQLRRRLQPAAGLQRLIGLEREVDFDTERIPGPNILLDAIGEMMDVDDDAVDSSVDQPPRHALQDRDPAHRDERLRHLRGEGAEAGAETRREDHRLHRLYGQCALTRTLGPARPLPVSEHHVDLRVSLPDMPRELFREVDRSVLAARTAELHAQ